MSLIPFILDLAEELHDFNRSLSMDIDDLGFGMYPLEQLATQAQPQQPQHPQLSPSLSLSLSPSQSPLVSTRRRLAAPSSVFWVPIKSQQMHRHHPYNRVAGGKTVCCNKSLVELERELAEKEKVAPIPTAAATKSAYSVVNRNGFQVSMNVKQFSPAELTVKTIDNCIVVEGQHDEKEDGHGVISRHFIRKYMLPKGFDPSEVHSTLSADGILTVKAPPPPPPMAKVGELRLERIVDIQQLQAQAKDAAQTPKSAASSSDCEQQPTVAVAASPTAAAAAAAASEQKSDEKERHGNGNGNGSENAAAAAATETETENVAVTVTEAAAEAETAVSVKEKEKEKDKETEVIAKSADNGEQKQKQQQEQPEPMEEAAEAAAAVEAVKAVKAVDDGKEQAAAEPKAEEDANANDVSVSNNGNASSSSNSSKATASASASTSAAVATAAAAPTDDVDMADADKDKAKAKVEAEAVPAEKVAEAAASASSGVKCAEKLAAADAAIILAKRQPGENGAKGEEQLAKIEELTN